MPYCVECLRWFDREKDRKCAGKIVEHGCLPEGAGAHTKLEELRRTARYAKQTFKSGRRTLRFDNDVQYLIAYTLREHKGSGNICHRPLADTTEDEEVSL